MDNEFEKYHSEIEFKLSLLSRAITSLREEVFPDFMTRELFLLKYSLSEKESDEIDNILLSFRFAEFKISKSIMLIKLREIKGLENIDVIVVDDLFRGYKDLYEDLFEK